MNGQREMAQQRGGERKRPTGTTGKCEESSERQNPPDLLSVLEFRPRRRVHQTGIKPAPPRPSVVRRRCPAVAAMHGSGRPFSRPFPFSLVDSFAAADMLALACMHSCLTHAAHTNTTRLHNGLNARLLCRPIKERPKAGRLTRYDLDSKNAPPPRAHTRSLQGLQPPAKPAKENKASDANHQLGIIAEQLDKNKTSRKAPADTWHTARTMAASRGTFAECTHMALYLGPPDVPRVSLYCPSMA